METKKSVLSGKFKKLVDVCDPEKPVFRGFLMIMMVMVVLGVLLQGVLLYHNFAQYLLAQVSGETPEFQLWAKVFVYSSPVGVLLYAWLVS